MSSRAGHVGHGPGKSIGCTMHLGRRSVSECLYSSTVQFKAAPGRLALRYVIAMSTLAIAKRRSILPSSTLSLALTITSPNLSHMCELSTTLVMSSMVRFSSERSYYKYYKNL